MDEDVIEKLVEDYGLSNILVQNDVSEQTVLKLLVAEGLVNLEDYIFEDVGYTDED